MTSPTHYPREEDCGAAADRPDLLRSTLVTGPAELEARLDMHLSQCRRRGGELSLLCVSVNAVTCAGVAVSADVERRVREAVSNRIGNAVRGGDTLLRESDRDTCVVLPGVGELTAERVRLRMERLVNGDYRVAGDLLQAVVRVGAATHPGQGERSAALLQRATDRG